MLVIVTSSLHTLLTFLLLPIKCSTLSLSVLFKRSMSLKMIYFYYKVQIISAKYAKQTCMIQNKEKKLLYIFDKKCVFQFNLYIFSLRSIFFLMENNNDIQEVRHTPKGFSGYYIQTSCSKSFAGRGWNIYAQNLPFTLLLIAQRFWLADSLPPSKK